MTPRSLQAVFRSLAAGPAAPDADLLARHLGGDDRAFGELVRRHGRLVWSACRGLTRSEAEADDAFQATFLVLLRNARKVRDPARLSAWLHGAAYKVCANARRAAAVRAAREKAAAATEGDDHAVPQAAWDRALAAVHQAAAGLPETLRVPFVLCCLEGVGPSEAARQLGWKLGTLSGRLTRAKDAVLARLDARGLAAGAVAGVGLVTPPSTAVARAAALAHAGSVVPASLLTLSHGVVGMSVNPLKALAAAAMIACGVGGTVGSGWMAHAQHPGDRPAAGPARPADPPAEVAALRAQLAAVQRQLDEATAKLSRAADAEALARLRAEAAVAREQAGKAEAVAAARLAGREAIAPASAGFSTPGYEYALVMAGGLDAATLRKLVLDHEVRGWEFAGTAPLNESTACVFRKPIARPSARGASLNPLTPLGAREAAKAAAAPAVSDAVLPPRVDRPVPGGLIAPAGPQGAAESRLGALYGRAAAPAVEDAAAVQAEIARLTAVLQKLKPAPAAPPLTVAFNTSSSAFEPETLAQVFSDLGRKKFGTGGRFNVSVTKGVVTVFGDQEVIGWASALVKKLSN